MIVRMIETVTLVIVLGFVMTSGLPAKGLESITKYEATGAIPKTTSKDDGERRIQIQTFLTDKSEISLSTAYAIFIPVIFNNYASVNINKTTTGKMMSDEIWRGDILITGDVEIPAGVILTIEPDTTVRFTAQSDDQHDEDEYDPSDPSTIHATMISILVFGILEARGTPNQPIIFTTDSNTPGSLDWQSIMLEGNGAVFLDYAIIEHGYFGVQLNSATLSATITHSTIRNTTTCGVCTQGHPIYESVIISDSRFIECGREAIDTYSDQKIIVQHNLFSENYVAIMSVGSSITVENNLFINNIRGIGVVKQGTPTIIGNEFTQTDGAAIFVTDSDPIISNNNLYANQYNMQLEGSTLGVKAENNWWGSDQTATIEASIWDGKDDPSLGVVDYEPFAVEAFDLEIPASELNQTNPL